MQKTQRFIRPVRLNSELFVKYLVRAVNTVENIHLVNQNTSN